MCGCDASMKDVCLQVSGLSAADGPLVTLYKMLTVNLPAAGICDDFIMFRCIVVVTKHCMMKRGMDLSKRR